MSKTKEVTIEQYREKLSSVCERASESTQKWLERHPGASRQEILDATYKITQAYGLAASTLAANKYDQDVALAEKQGFLKPGQIKEAEVWDPLGYGSIARAINGTLKNDSKEKLPDTIERMVKRFAEDTTLMNARRDGAEYAWIPAGDTCVFCLSLASNGWQRASRSTAEGNHADHIHPHCDCTFSVRFSKDTNVKGYHPEKLKALIESQDGDTWNEKLNSLRRKKYADRVFYCYGDYLRDVMGSAKDNNVEEFQRIKKEIEEAGGKLILLKNNTKMVTNVQKGEPAIVEVDENISIGGLMHEYRHFKDDLEAGCPGFAHYLKNPDAFFEYERRGYEEELEIARKNGYNDIVKKIENEIEKRRKEIYGKE